VIFMLYGCLVGGIVLLVAELRGRLTVPAGQLGRWRLLGVVAAAVPGIGPLLAWITGSLGVSWPFPLVAIAYVVAFAVLALGVAGWTSSGSSRVLRRIGYLGLLVLGALPSFVLLLLAPAILLAGATLVEPRGLANTATSSTAGG
jgi:hypothetical protein